MDSYDFLYNTTLVSEKNFNEHIKLYNTYVDKFNLIKKNKNSNGLFRIDSNAIYSNYRESKKGEIFTLDSIILHELYFNNIGNETIMPNELKIELNQYFGDWQEDFVSCAKSARGWAVLYYDLRNKSFSNILLDSHDCGVLVCGEPIVVIDVYEHAYYMDYGIKKEEYIRNFIKSIKWDVVSKRIKNLDRK